MKTAPQLIISLAIIILFSVAFFRSPDDEILKGALIAGFAASYGFWLGSSIGSKTSGDAVRKIADRPSVTATGDNPTVVAQAPSSVNVEPTAPEAEKPPWER